MGPRRLYCRSDATSARASGQVVGTTCYWLPPQELAIALPGVQVAALTTAVLWQGRYLTLAE